MAKHVICGMGEVGSALKEILEAKHEVLGIDKGQIIEGEHDVLHICFPFSKQFIHFVEQYRFLSKAKLIIIHSSVPVGTTDLIPDAVHSPIRGVHPNLVGGIKTFVKYFGGEKAKEAALIFSELGIQTEASESSKNTEALKLWDTTAYGLNIILEKVIHQFCLERGLDFDLVYKRATESYNGGYEQLGMGYVRRPVLKHMEGPIGGHCVIPNARLLGTPIADLILRINDVLCSSIQAPTPPLASSKMLSSSQEPTQTTSP